MSAQQSASASNGVLHRELAEVVPLCLTKLGDEQKAKEFLAEKLLTTTNYDHRNSIMYCMLRHLSKEVLPLSQIIDLLPIQRDEVKPFNPFFKLKFF